MRIPRLLVVADGDGELPLPIDCLEDWVTTGAPEWEVDARRRALLLRAGQHAVRPLLDEDGLLHHRDAWVSLSPVEQALAAVLLDRFGAVDILVNNAATNPYAGPTIGVDSARLDKTYEVNLRGPLLWSQVAWNRYMSDHGGVIINIAAGGAYATSSQRRRSVASNT